MDPNNNQHNGPYLVRVECACGCPCERCSESGSHVVSLEAVATLRDTEALDADDRRAVEEATTPVQIGNPDGTTTAVEETTWERLAEEAAEPYFNEASRPRVLAVWNERCGVKREGVARWPLVWLR